MLSDTNLFLLSIKSPKKLENIFAFFLRQSDCQQS